MKSGGCAAERNMAVNRNFTRAVQEGLCCEKHAHAGQENNYGRKLLAAKRTLAEIVLRNCARNTFCLGEWGKIEEGSIELNIIAIEYFYFLG